MNAANQEIDPLRLLSAAACSFANDIDIWMKRYGRELVDIRSDRVSMLRTRAALQRFHGACGVNKSIGFYGESQCGKSNLVSRIGRGIGASTTTTQSLLVADVSTGGPWRSQAADGAEIAAIEFIKWLDPRNGSESTGIISRFSFNRPSVEGCYDARVMSHEDLVISLALGFVDDVKFTGEGAEKDARKVVEEVRDAQRENDPDNFMAALLGAWFFLEAHRSDHPLVKSLEAAGWPELVKELFCDGMRPVWTPRGRGPGVAPYSRLSGLLWPEPTQAMAAVYDTLLVQMRKLGGTLDIAIPVGDVCRSAPDAPVTRSSLLDISLIDGLFKDSANFDSVQVRFTAKSGERVVGLARAALVALIREIELPLVRNGGAEVTEGDRIDILDYPGARAITAGADDFANDDDPMKLALKVFRRGKLNRLFLSGVELQDCSALCLAVAGARNLEAGPVVRTALGGWLEREGWVNQHPNDLATRLDIEGDLVHLEPPLIVAVTMADALVQSGGLHFAGRIEDMKRHYCSGLNWLDGWTAAEKFRRIHWVHNPDCAKKLPSSYSEIEQQAIVKNYMGCELISDHVEIAKEKIEAVFAIKPSDVSLLCDTLMAVAKPIERDVRIASGMAKVVKQLEQKTARWYRGATDEQLQIRERESGVADVNALKGALGKRLNPVSELLRALSITAIDVERALRQASVDAIDVDTAEVGVISFEDFYAALRGRFAAQLDREIVDKKAPWIEYLRQPSGGEGDVDRLTSIVEHFRRIPTSDWFYKQIEKNVGPLVRRQNVASLSGSVVGAITSSIWNRSMRWLDEIPDPPEAPVANPPKVRVAHAASTRILDHWAERLPEVYVDLVDPTKARSVGNPELGEIRQRMCNATRMFVGVQAPATGMSNARKQLLAEMSSLVASLNAGLDSAPVQD